MSFGMRRCDPGWMAFWRDLEVTPDDTGTHARGLASASSNSSLADWFS